MHSRSIFGLIQSQGDRRPDSEFLLSSDDRDSLTFAGLRDLALEFAWLLRGMGVSTSDRVVTALPNGPESASLFLATAGVAACAPLNPNYSANQFAFYIDDLEPAAVVLPEGSESVLRRVATDAGIPIIELSTSATAGRFSTPSAFSPGTLGEIADIGGVSDIGNLPGHLSAAIYRAEPFGRSRSSVGSASRMQREKNFLRTARGRGSLARY